MYTVVTAFSTWHSPGVCFRNRPRLVRAPDAPPATSRRACGLRRTLGDTPIRVRLHCQPHAGRVPDIIGGDRHTARLNNGAHHLLAAEVPEQPTELAIAQQLLVIVAIATSHDSRADTIACLLLNRCSVPPTKFSAGLAWYLASLAGQFLRARDR